MFAAIESFWHRLRRRLSRNEWAVRHLRRPPAKAPAKNLVCSLIQIDGLPRRQMEAAMAAGRMPFLRRLREHGRYPLHTFYSGLPSTTPAVQGELYSGIKTGVPAFSFLDRERGEMGMLLIRVGSAIRGEVCESQRRIAQRWKLLVEHFLGGASSEESNFCVAHTGFGDVWRGGRIFNVLFFILLQAPAMLRITCLVLLELVIGLPEAARGILRGQWFSQELGMVLSRMCVGVALREIVTIGGKVDVTRGLPIVHLNFLGYDKLPHRRGPASKFTHWSLRGIDRAIKDLYLAAYRSQRRDYHVWIFSDHGQEETRSFAMEFSDGIKSVVAKCVENVLATEAAWRTRANGHPLPSLFRKRDVKRSPLKERLLDAFSVERGQGFSIAATGPLGHLYFAQSIDDAQKRSLARQFIDHGKLPGVLHRTVDGKSTWYHADGETTFPKGCLKS